MPEKIWKAADWIMLLAFVFAIAVQYNDSDPWAWVAIYGLAAGASTLALLGRGHWVFPAAVASVSTAWALTIAPRVLGQVRFLDMFGAFEMESLAIEESREMYGLLLIAIWMVALAVRGARAGGRETEG